MSDVLLMIFINIKCQCDFIMGKKPVAQRWGCHDLHTTDGESVLKRTAIGEVVYTSQTGIGLNRGYYIKGSHLFSKHAFIELRIPQRYIGGPRKCFKVYIAEGVPPICVHPNKNCVCFTQNPVHPVYSII